MARLIVGIVFILLNFYVYRYLATEDFIPQREEFIDFPLALEDWYCENPGEMTSASWESRIICSATSPMSRSTGWPTSISVTTRARLET